MPDQQKNVFLHGNTFFIRFAFSLDLNKMVEECHRTFKYRFAATFNFHVNVELDFGYSSQVGHRPKKDSRSYLAVYTNRLVKPKTVNPIINKHFNVFNLYQFIPHIG